MLIALLSVTVQTGLNNQTTELRCAKATKKRCYALTIRTVAALARALIIGAIKGLVPYLRR